MAIIELDQDYSAHFRPYRYGSGCGASGVILCRGSIVDSFEVRSLTALGVTRAAQRAALRIHRRLKAADVVEKKKSVPKAQPYQNRAPILPEHAAPAR